MTDIKLINTSSGEDANHTSALIADFLYMHLGEYGDSRENISKCLAYVFHPLRGGFIVLATEMNTILGAAVVNYTGMSGYIPENILVYIAVHKEHRGKSLGRQLLDQVKILCKGDIALHVEKDNPAKRLYERAGFSNPYLEMRLKR